MKPAQAFAAFGIGLSATQKIVYAGAAVMLFSGTMSLLQGDHLDGKGIGPFYFLAFAGIMWWSVAANRTLMLVQDAYRLRMPAAIRATLAGLIVHFVCIVAAPAAVAAVHGSAGFSAMLAFGTCLALGAFAAPVLPRTFSLAGGMVGLLPLLCWLLANKGILPGVRDNGFSLWAWSAAAAMAYFLYHRRHALLEDSTDDTADGGTLLLGRYRRQLLSGSSGWDASLQDFSTPGATKRIRLDAAKPGNPVQAVQVWLGNPFAPVSVPMQAQRYLLPLLISVLTAFLFVSLHLVNNMGLVVIIFGQNAFMTLRNLFVPRLISAFAGNGGDLELLGTQPGIGSGETAKRAVLVAVFKPLLIGCAVQFVCMVALAQAMSGIIGEQLVHGNVFQISSVVAALVCGDVFVAVLMLNALIGRAIARWNEVLLLILAMLIALTIGNAPFASPYVNALVITLLLGFFVPLAWLGVRAWREFRRRAHPFVLGS